MLRYILICLLASFQFSCSNSKIINSQNSTNIKSLIFDSTIDYSVKGDNYVVDSLFIKDDILTILVNYSGGCKSHEFSLYSNGTFAKSLPVQATLLLKHNGNLDLCKKLVVEELKFNIKELKKKPSEKIIIKIEDKKTIY